MKKLLRKLPKNCFGGCFLLSISIVTSLTANKTKNDEDLVEKLPKNALKMQPTATVAPLLLLQLLKKKNTTQRSSLFCASSVRFGVLCVCVDKRRTSMRSLRASHSSFFILAAHLCVQERILPASENSQLKTSSTLAEKQT